MRLNFSLKKVTKSGKRKFEKAGDVTGQPDLEKYRMLVGAYLKPELNPEIVALLSGEIFSDKVLTV